MSHTTETATYIKQRPHSVRGILEMQRMLLPDLETIARSIRAVPPGKSRSLTDIRRELATEFGADGCCLVTTQRHVKALAEQAVAAHQAGGEDAVPFWRVVDPQKPGSARLAGGRDFILARRAEEVGRLSLIGKREL